MSSPSSINTRQRERQTEFTNQRDTIMRDTICSLNIEAVLFQTIQFRISTKFGSLWPIDRTLSGGTSSDQSRPESDGNEGVFRISKSISNTDASPSNCFVSYPWDSLGRSYPSPEKQLVYSTAPTYWASGQSLSGGVLHVGKDAVSVFCNLKWLGL